MSDDFLRTAGNLAPALSARFARPPIGARVYNSGNLSINNTTITTLTFDSEVFDDADIHSTSSNTGLFTAPTDGTYLVGACVAWATNATGFRLLRMTAGGGVVINKTTPAVSGDRTIMLVETVVRLSAGGTIYADVYQNSGGALNVDAVSAYSPYMWIWRLS